VGLFHRYRSAFLSLLIVMAVSSFSGAAYAQSSTDDKTTKSTKVEVKPDFKGVFGLGLIGAELGFVIPAIVGVDDWWAYVVFPTVGAAGGGIAGYFLLEQGTGHAEIAVASLVAGMALAIPAAVLTLALTAYNPEKDFEEEVEEPAKTTAAQKHQKLTGKSKIQQLAREAGPGLVRVSDKGLFLGAPAVTPIIPSFSSKEELKTNQQPRAELRIALLSGCF
jgi:hypothetical protein